jgi:hypothetical protein
MNCALGAVRVMSRAAVCTPGSVFAPERQVERDEPRSVEELWRRSRPAAGTVPMLRSVIELSVGALLPIARSD